jgi:penicillin amidase
LHPGRPRLEPDGTLDIGIIDQNSLGPYPGSRAPVHFLPEDVEPDYRIKEHRAADHRAVSEAEFQAAEADRQDATSQGSNNWVISPERSFSRSAIMANDPHRAIELPSLRYWVHLVAPGWNVIGAGEPALPGVSVGHNENGAWGFTIFAIDQEDLYVYETDPAEPTRYRYAGAWESMTTVRETIPVKGWAAMPAELRFTRHGPVIHEDREHHRAYALRAAWLLEGTAPYLASLRIDQAGSWDDFRQACAYFLTPSENMVWADVHGQIGWQAVGLAPRRANWDGLLPVPGDGRYEWDGFLLATDLPYVVNPSQGWFATANQNNLPLGYPHTVGFQWTDPFRFARIEEVLGSGRRWTMADMMRLQQDELSLPARTLVPMLRGLTPPEGPARQAAQRLESWNFVLDRDSVPAAIYTAWEKAVRTAVWELMVPQEARRVFLPGTLSMEKIIDWLMAPDGRFGADPIAGRNTLLSKALDRATSELEHRLGPDMSRWKYGQAVLKHVQLKHPLSGAVRTDLQARLDLGPLPRGGYGHSVNSTSDNDNQSTGASFRIIADTGDWDRSVGTNTPGQSGDSDSPHYRDLFKPWAKGEYFPVLFSRSKVESVAEAKTVLVPQENLSR